MPIRPNRIGTLARIRTSDGTNKAPAVNIGNLAIPIGGISYQLDKGIQAPGESGDADEWGFRGPLYTINRDNEVSVHLVTEDVIKFATPNKPCVQAGVRLPAPPRDDIAYVYEVIVNLAVWQLAWSGDKLNGWICGAYMGFNDDTDTPGSGDTGGVIHHGVSNDGLSIQPGMAWAGDAQGVQVREAVVVEPSTSSGAQSMILACFIQGQTPGTTTNAPSASQNKAAEVHAKGFLQLRRWIEDIEIYDPTRM